MIKNLLFFPGLYFFLQMVNFASSDLQVVVSSLGAIFQSFQLKRLTSDNKFHIHTTPRAQKCDSQWPCDNIFKDLLLYKNMITARRRLSREVQFLIKYHPLVDMH